jgi:putative DNA primase/helicase
LDSDLSILPFLNGVYDFKVKKFRNYADDDFVTKYINYEYSPVVDQESKRFINAFFEKLFDDQIERQYILGIIASCLTPNIGREYLYFFKGSGQNGKSLLCSLISKTLECFTETLPSKFFSKDKDEIGSANPAIINLRHKRLAVVSEANGGEYKSELIKRMTNKDEISSRKLYSNNIETFSIFTKFVVLINDIPTFSSNDDALWRRITVIPFRNKFVTNPKRANERKADDTLYKLFEFRTDIYYAFINLILDNYDVNFDPIEQMPIAGMGKLRPV